LYKDDGTVFAWELINEARLPQDMSGDTLQVRCAGWSVASRPKD
jgi:hypothetical protein